MKTVLVPATILFASATTATGKPPLVPIDAGASILVQPLRAAPAKIVNGRIVVGDWQDYGGVSARSPVWCGWDAFGRDWGVGSNANMIYGDYCGMAPATRWSFGVGYNCPLFVDDIVNVSQSGALIDEINFAWTWEGTGNCDIVVFLSDDSADCSNGDPLSHSYYSGVMFSFGSLPGSPGTLYASNFTGLVGAGYSLPLPSSGGSYLVAIGDASSGTLEFQPWATQSLLWGAKERLSPPYSTASYIEGCGSNDSFAWDDDNPSDALFSSSECYTYSFGLCPDPLNHMIAFGISQPPCPPCTPTPVTKHYRLKGAANGTPWTWGITDSPYTGLLVAHGMNTGVSGNICTLASALVSDINTYSAQDLCPSNALQAALVSCKPNKMIARISITAQVCPGQSFDLFTGNGNVDPTCLVPAWPAIGCQFNPEIVEIVPSGLDCNGNGQDDAFDIADGDSEDVNNDGVPDECQCPADFNGDGFVNGDDYDSFAALFDAGDGGADINGDGFVNGDDYDYFAEHFDAGC